MTPAGRLRKRTPVLVWAALVAGLSIAGCGGDEQTATPGPPGQRVSVTSLAWGGVPAALTWVAVQDGDGPWRRLEASTGRYDFEVSSGRYRLAFVCLRRRGTVIAATVAELPAITVSCTEFPTGPKHTWSGAITGTPAGRPVPVGFYSRHGSFPGIVSGDRYTAELPPGTYDLMAIEVDQRLAPIFLRRNIEVSAAGTADVDFGGASVIRPILRAVAPPVGAPGEGLGAMVSFHSANGVWITFSRSSATQIPMIPASDLVPGDTQELWVTGSSPDSSRATRKVLDGSEALPALELPPAFDSLELLLPSPGSSGGTWRPGARFDPYPGAVFYAMSFSSSEAGIKDLGWELNVGAGWLAGNTTFELPDLTGAPGFDVTWGPGPRGPHSVVTTVFAGTRSFGSILNGERPVPPGTVTTYARRDYGLPPPIAP